MSDTKAVHYGQVEIIPGIKCDGYALDDELAVLSERGTADLLGMKQASFQTMAPKWPLESIKPFINNDISMAPKLVKVVAKNSPHQGRYIIVYSTSFIESIINGYALAFANDALRPNQRHIGKRGVILQSSLVKTALETAIRKACKLTTNIQAIQQQNYIDIVTAMQECGLKCSVNHEIAIKTDITNFLEVSPSTLTHFLNKHRETIKPIKLDKKMIQAIGSRATHMNGYRVQDVGTIALSLNTVMGIRLKEKVFGNPSRLAKWETKGKIEWQQLLALIFAGLSFYHNYQIGQYRVDFYVRELNLILECNGYDAHASYDPAYEEQREQFLSHYRVVRFHYLTDWKTLVNAILRVEVGTIIKLYDSLFLDETLFKKAC